MDIKLPLRLLVNTGSSLLLRLFRYCCIAGKADPGLLDQFLNIVKMRAGRAMIIILAYAACQFNENFMGFDVV